MQQRELFGDGGPAESGALARAQGGTLLLESIDQLAPAVLQRLTESLRSAPGRVR